MNNSKEFMIINVIVSFGRGEQPREIGTRMSVVIGICLEEYPPEACLEASVAIAKVLVLLGRGGEKVLVQIRSSSLGV